MANIFTKTHDSKRMETLRYYYEVLRVRPGASLQEINQAYINLLNELQPARMSNDPRRQQKAQAVAQEINEAYREIKRIHTLRRGGEPVYEYAEPDPPQERVPRPAMALPSREKEPAEKAPAHPRRPHITAKGALVLAAAAAIVVAVKSLGPAPVARPGAQPAKPEQVPRKATAPASKPAAGHDTRPSSHSQLPRRHENEATPAQASRTGVPRESKRDGDRPDRLAQPAAQAAPPVKAAALPAAAVPAGDAAVQHAIKVRKAAERGDSVAQARLGYLYMNGKGVPQDYAEAARWNRRAAEQGHVGGEYWLGYQCEAGQGVPQNLGEAARWYKKAAEQGDVEAQKRLALLYVQGRGVAKDPQEAAKWYRKAAGQGDAEAQSALDGLPGR